MKCLSARRTALLGATLMVVLPGCKEDEGQPVDRQAHAEQVVKVVCDAYVACDCADEATVLDNDPECPVALQPGVEAAMANAADLGLRFFPGCLETYDAYLDAVGCNTAFEVEDLFDDGEPVLRKLTDDVAHCKLLAGSMGRGETCASISVPGGGLIGDNCEHALVCADGLCRPWPTAQGHWCGGLFDCPGDLACLDPDADGVLTCEPRATDGQLCNPHDGLGCVEGLYCDADELECDKLPKAGQPCLDDPFAASSCALDSVCIADTCEALLDIGDDCQTGVCNPELAYCNTTSWECTKLPGKGDECIESSGACRPGLTCLGDGSDLECQEDQPMVCFLPEAVGVCIYAQDGICDEPEGTDLCAEGTDPLDCEGASESGPDSGPDSDSDSDSGDTDSGPDSDSDSGDTDTGDGGCASYGDGVCDEPEGTGYCAEGTDPLDCAYEDCPYQEDGTCDEPEGTGYCVEGSDPYDCDDFGGSTGGDVPPGDAVCNNGVIDPGEQCDAAELDNYTCAILGYTGGTLYCDPVDCVFDTSYCT